jgi:hypothetical protein
MNEYNFDEKKIFNNTSYDANLTFVFDTMEQAAQKELTSTLSKMKEMSLTKEEELDYLTNHMQGYFTGFLCAVGTLVDEHLAFDLLDKISDLTGD